MNFKNEQINDINEITEYFELFLNVAFGREN